MMSRMQNRIPATIALMSMLVTGSAYADVVRVDVATRGDVGSSGYERIAGIIHFAVDPAHPRNRIIANLDKAPRNAAGQVEFSADLYILRPKDAARSNGVALIEVSNRGRKGLLGGFSQARASLTPAADADLGDGLLTRQGYTLVWVGWQFDVDRSGDLLGIQVPAAKGAAGIVRAEFTPGGREEQAIADLSGYSPIDAMAADTTLTVRDGPYGAQTTIARSRWTLRGNTVSLNEGFEPGRTYTVSFRSADLPVTGLGLAAFRDTASWVKHRPDALATARHAIAWGSSQSGRFLRTFLYYGFNADERDRQVLDGVMAHIAGAGRLSINEAAATPNALSMYSGTVFPYADAAMRDPLSGRTEGLLDNDRARNHQPKVFYTNSAVEYWGGGRAAALVHTSPDGTRDLTLPDNVRVYHLAGTQHSPGPFPPRVTGGQQPTNPVEYWYTLRALLGAMERWVKNGQAPPASQHPRLSDGTLVSVDAVRFPALPGVASPRTIPGARHGETRLPFLVPQVDADGNELAGIRSPEVAVAVATYTGWNFRSPATGGAAFLVNLMGSAIPFPRSAAERNGTRDPRKSLEERYASREAYVAAFRQHADTLVKGGYLLAEDVPELMRRADEQWAHATAAAAATSGRTSARP
jgi:hypothetical protein